MILSLCSSQVGEVQTFFADVRLVRIALLVGLVWCLAKVVNGHCLMNALFVDCDGVWRCRYYL